jgi:hypothetical protein
LRSRQAHKQQQEQTGTGRHVILAPIRVFEIRYQIQDSIHDQVSAHPGCSLEENFNVYIPYAASFGM